jgi:hypothetical protein
VRGLDDDARKRRSDLLLGVGARLHSLVDDVDHARGEVRGNLRGVAVKFRLTTRETTEIDVPIEHVPLELELRPRGAEDEGDVRVGDEEFDRTFVVEAAPVDVARALLAAQLRERLLQLSPVTVRTMGPGWLRVEQMWWPRMAVLGAHLIELALDVAQRVPVAFEEADALLRSQASTGGGPFREQVDADAERAATARRKRDWEDLARVRQRRRVRERVARLLRHLFKHDP